MENYLANYKPNDEICLSLVHLSSKEENNKQEVPIASPTQHQLNEMFVAMKSLFAEYGFELDCFGIRTDFEKLLGKTYGKQKWHEGAQAMITKLSQTKPEAYAYLAELRASVPDHNLITTPEFQP